MQSAPTSRKLTVIAKDPGLRLPGPGNPMIMTQVDIPAELLGKGPTGYRVKVVDYNASEGLAYLDEQSYQDPGTGELRDPFLPRPGETPVSPAYQQRLLANPNFHAQNCYAVVMRTLTRFEHALGRRVSWRAGIHQLNVAPHAFEQANAFYSPPDHALMFGYFYRSDGSPVFTCLSHDIVAHETSHALLDGIRPRYTEAGGPDQAALHEALADIVALLSIFSLEPVVAAALRRGEDFERSHNNIELIAAADLTPKRIRESILLGIAREVGNSLEANERDALRRSVLIEPDATILASGEMQEEHVRGEILVAAVMHSFVRLWTARIAALGTFGRRRYNLAMVVGEGAKLADQLLTMCIRALDYCPPTDIDFGQYLAGLLTADQELVPDDSRYGYRHAIRTCFAEFGIRPPAEGTDPDTGAWLLFDRPGALSYGRANYDALTRDRDEFFRFLWDNRDVLDISERCDIEVVSIDHSTRLGPDGLWLTEYICQYVQSAHLFGAETEAILNCPRPAGLATTARIDAFGGGVIVLNQYGQVKYHIANRIDQGTRQFALLSYLLANNRLTSLAGDRNRFALLHQKRMGG